MEDEMKQYIRMVSFLGETIGNAFEAILFDVTAFDYPIIASANIHDSTVEKARGFIRDAMDSPKTKANGYYTNYAVKMDTGKLSKMSVFYVYNHSKEIIGALCLCMRCDVFMKMESLISGFLQFDLNDLNDNNDLQGSYPSFSKEPSLETISEYIRTFGVEPGRTTYNENIEIICDLYDMGIFNLKGAVSKTAEELQISSKTVYRYLASIKRARD